MDGVGLYQVSVSYTIYILCFSGISLDAEAAAASLPREEQLILKYYPG